MSEVRITYRQLANLGAYRYHLRLFRKTFDDSAIVNEKNALKAVAAHLDIGWLAERVLTGDAQAEYERVRDTARAEYERVRALAFVRAYAMQVEG